MTSQEFSDLNLAPLLLSVCQTSGTSTSREESRCSETTRTRPRFCRKRNTLQGSVTLKCFETSISTKETAIDPDISSPNPCLMGSRALASLVKVEHSTAGPRLMRFLHFILGPVAAGWVPGFLLALLKWSILLLASAFAISPLHPSN